MWRRYPVKCKYKNYFLSWWIYLGALIINIIKVNLFIVYNFINAFADYFLILQLLLPATMHTAILNPISGTDNLRKINLFECNLKIIDL